MIDGYWFDFIEDASDLWPGEFAFLQVLACNFACYPDQCHREPGKFADFINARCIVGEVSFGPWLGEDYGLRQLWALHSHIELWSKLCGS